ncbi:hypothetical protein GOP47_0010055 [Adiantum capillus-veneris]|uniref:Uncharacterized protein n=1 Tax=Adiantum capillus-veneris TaxID=13818 RepID=A0A9D4ZG16_ADICA|nr:hypothetical protein GOP47_0010055 [Adiantum capillus-veneris]
MSMPSPNTSCATALFPSPSPTAPLRSSVSACHLSSKGSIATLVVCCRVALHQSGYSKVGYVCVEMGVQENVAGLNIPMNNGGRTIMMKQQSSFTMCLCRIFPSVATSESNSLLSLPPPRLVTFLSFFMATAWPLLSTALQTVAAPPLPKYWIAII